jgi:hypothetical protein
MHAALPPTSYMPSRYDALIQEMLPLTLQRMDSTTSSKYWQLQLNGILFHREERGKADNVFTC